MDGTYNPSVTGPPAVLLCGAGKTGFSFLRGTRKPRVTQKAGPKDMDGSTGNMNNRIMSSKIYRISIVLLALMIGAAILASPLFAADGTAKADTYKYRLQVKADVLNVRAKASSSSKRLGQLKKKQEITATYLVKDKSGTKWYRFKYKGKTAYVIASQTKNLYMVQTYKTKKKAYITATALNVRAKASTKGKKVGTVLKNKTIYIKSKSVTKSGVVWYRFTYKSKNAYVNGKFVKIGSPSKAVTTSTTQASNTDDFEAYMKEQGFPASYKPYLRKLHKEHPKWIFIAKKAGYSWDTLNTKARKRGVNCIDSTLPKSWRSTASSVYNSKTKTWTTFDGGRWYQASNKVIAYYLDPRNFLNDSCIFEFMGHKFDSKSQNKNTIKSITSVSSSCFMNNTTYTNYLYNAGKNAGVNPNVITAMIVEEQGWRGTSGLISGTYPGYKGYYNYFNIGAYSSGSMSAVQRGLWWAKGAGVGATSYGRPWNTRQKAITGGAMFYGQNYINNKQDTYYTKKFNVMNGSSSVGTHEYMTNVCGAVGEGKILAYAYRNNSNYPIKFYIPVYSGMPSKACSL